MVSTMEAHGRSEGGKIKYNVREEARKGEEFVF